MTPCFSCEQVSRLAQLPVRDRVYVGHHWRIAHAWSALPGWLILISQRHLTHIGDLDEAEAAGLGQLLRCASAALTTVVGCDKTYVIMYAEQPGFEHLHFHVVPRMADFDQRHRASGVFDFLKRPESEWVPVEERDRLGTAIADELTRLGIRSTE